MVTAPLLIALLGLLGYADADRPANASTCDYYAEVKYGANNSHTQFQLIQGIVGLAFGGAFNLSNVSSQLTGVLNPGTFSGEQINLLPWFDGTKASSNLDNEPTSIDWLDGGGLDPLYRFLSGETSSLQIDNTTNQYRLFSDFTVAYARIFGCSDPPSSDSTTAHLSIAYVHKFMNLTFNDLGHFIDMLTLSSIHYGFSDEDAQTFNSSMNARYNVRCAPAVTINAAQGPELFSLCQNPTCPLAEPDPDCAAYVNLTADGSVGSSNTGMVTSSVTLTLTSSATSSTAMGSTAMSSTAMSSTAMSSPTTTTTSSSSGPVLSGGAIGGIVIGVVAVVGIFVLAALLIWRRKRNTSKPPPTTVGTSTLDPSVYSSSGRHGSYMVEAPSDGRPSYLWNSPPVMVSEVDAHNMRDSVLSRESHQSHGPAGEQSPRMTDGLHSPRWSPELRGSPHLSGSGFPKVTEEENGPAELSGTGPD